MTGVGHVISTVRKKKAKTVDAQLVSSFLTVQAPTLRMVLYPPLEWSSPP